MGFLSPVSSFAFYHVAYAPHSLVCFCLILLLLSVLRQDSGSPGKLQTFCKAEDDLNLLILPPSIPKSWDHRYVSP